MKLITPPMTTSACADQVIRLVQIVIPAQAGLTENRVARPRGLVVCIVIPARAGTQRSVEVIDKAALNFR